MLDLSLAFSSAFQPPKDDAPQASAHQRTESSGFRVLVATDAWRPQVNGVVRTLEGLVAEAPKLGAAITVLGPDRFPSVPMPGYPDIRLAAPSPHAIAEAIERIR